MAKIFYLLKQNNTKTSKIYGKWFARGKTTETLNTRKMANHIAEHGSIYTPDVVFGVLEKFRSCLLEMLLNSKRVKIDGLGIFFTTIENEKGGALKKEDFSPAKNLKALHIRFLPDQEAALKKEDFSPAKNLKALHIRFLPDQEAETNISSREFIKKAEFVNAETFAGQLTEEEDKPSNSGGGGSQGGNTGGGGHSNEPIGD